ncbi:4'-phosphopantetheinyl transferase family protein [Leifsonia sp. NPDC056665]|uniref:4'-phosphopantetheinyl transferase family protein n=1 Tax=Leifsonia sp. NPDC056665 TaxID=3345901 RepID=UPI0036C46A29
MHSASVPMSASTILSPDERARLHAFGDADAARDYLAAHVAARWAIAERLPIQPEHVSFARQAKHGKPLLPGTGLHFSLSHSRGLSVVLVSDTGPVGVDSEPLNRVYSERLFRRILADREIDDILHTTESVPDRFVSMWTRKEAVLKALGTGLAIDPKEVVVADRVTTLFPGRVNEAHVPIRTQSFVVGGSHMCAAASAIPFSEMHVRELTISDLRSQIRARAVSCS